jgi:hypothetical protein
MTKSDEIAQAISDLFTSNYKAEYVAVDSGSAQNSAQVWLRLSDGSAFTIRIMPVVELPRTRSSLA